MSTPWLQGERASGGNPVARFLLTAALLLSGSGIPLLAQTPANPNTPEPIVELSPYYVTLFHWEGEAQEVPARIGITLPSDLRQQAATSLPEALGGISGLQARSFGSAAQSTLSLRGFGENGHLRTLVLVDGLRLNRPDMGALNWHVIPIPQITRVEVIKGSQTTLYGNQAVGGVIKISTRHPSDQLTLLQAQAGSFGQRAGSLSTALDLKSLGYLSLFAEKGFSNGHRDRSASTYETLALQHRWEQKHWRLESRWAFADSYAERPGPLTREKTDADPTSASLRAGYENEYNRSLHIRAAYDAATDWQAELSLAYHNRELTWQLDGPLAENRTQTWHASPRWFRQNGPWQTTLGSDLLLDRLDFEAFKEPDFTRHLTDATLTRWQSDLYAHTQWEQHPWLWTAGLRLSHTSIAADALIYHRVRNRLQTSYDENAEDAGWSVNLGLVRFLPHQQRIWARLDRLYRYPVTDEVAYYQGYQPSQDDPSLKPFNTDLQPETGYNAELGWERTGDTLKLAVNVFSQWMEDEIEFIPVESSSFVQQRRNANLPETLRYGLETEASWCWDPATIELGYTWIEATYEDGPYAGNDRYLVPQHDLRGSLSYRALENLTVGLEGRYQSSAYIGNDLENVYPKMPAYALWHARLHWQITPQWDFLLRVNNLFDRAYYYTVYLGDWYPAPGRHMRLQTTYTF